MASQLQLLQLLLLRIYYPVSGRPEVSAIYKMSVSNAYTPCSDATRVPKTCTSSPASQNMTTSDMDGAMDYSVQPCVSLLISLAPLVCETGEGSGRPSLTRRYHLRFFPSCFSPVIPSARGGVSCASTFYELPVGVSLRGHGRQLHEG